ncbi:MAG: hypothetical protein CM1200mP26_22230 [Acidimicrobiales bacterium]|nr:MAG: hypothetical protein CM1200mP26_22230 [Acidimicrobiales bacterium]
MGQRGGVGLSEHDDAPDGARSSGIADNALPEAYDTMSKPIYDAKTFWELVERRVVTAPTGRSSSIREETVGLSAR